MVAGSEQIACTILKAQHHLGAMLPPRLHEPLDGGVGIQVRDTRQQFLPRQAWIVGERLPDPMDIDPQPVDESKPLHAFDEFAATSASQPEQHLPQVALPALRRVGPQERRQPIS